MNYSPKTFILLTTLIGLALFLGGFRLGKQVEHFDKTYIPSPTVTPILTPYNSPTPQINKFKTFFHAPCELSFLYPDTLKESSNSTTGASLRNGSSIIQLDCSKNLQSSDSAKYMPSPTTTTINNRTFTIYPGPISNKWTINNPLTGRKVFFTTSKPLTELLMRTLEFVKKTTE